ncbi:MAG: serine dehydratase beta chain, partial [Pirellulaceae bacterium]
MEYDRLSWIERNGRGASQKRQRLGLFDRRKTIVFHFQEALSYHPNGMRFTARTSTGQSISEIYYSVGGGFVV